jgi:protein SCO1
MNNTAGIILFGVLVSGAGAQSPWVAPAARGVAFEQRIGGQLPLDTRLRDENRREVQLADFFHHEPVVVIFGYSRCPQLCAVVSNGTVGALRDLSATAGRDYRVVYVSIDPTDTPRDLAAMKRRDVGRYGRTGAEEGWHYLAGDESAIRRLTAAAGFHYTFDAHTKLYAHPSGFLVATPDGRIARYFLGVDFDPKEIASALERASAGKTGEPTFNLLLVCARGLGITGRYGQIIWMALSVAVVTTALGVFGGIGWMLRAERRAKQEPVP